MTRIRLMHGDGFVLTTLPEDDCSGPEAPYVPDSEELMALYRYWLDEAESAHVCVVITGHCGSGDLATIQHARWRMETIADHLTNEEIATALVQGLIDTRARRGAGFDLPGEAPDTGFVAGWWRPVWDAASAENRYRDSNPCNCRLEPLEVPFGGEDDRPHTCERVTTRRAAKEAFARLVAWVQEERRLRPGMPREGEIR